MLHPFERGLSGQLDDPLDRAVAKTECMNIILVGIIASEVGFWVVLLAGLVLRYLVRKRKVSTIVLLGVPVLDLVLLSLITWDMLINNAVAEFTHGLGAIYLSFTVVFGPQIIRKADAWFAYRFASGPKPHRPEDNTWEKVKYEWSQWLRLLVCASLGCLLLGAMILIVDDVARTEELTAWFGRLGLVAVVWLIGWPIWETVKFIGTPRRVHER